MKRLLLALAAVILVGAGSSACAAEQAAKKVSIANNAQVDIYTLCVSPTNAKMWEANLLEEKVLPNGDVADVMISRTPTAEAWDVKVTDKQGNEMTWIGLPLNKAGNITLLPNGEYAAK